MPWIHSLLKQYCASQMTHRFNHGFSILNTFLGDFYGPKITLKSFSAFYMTRHKMVPRKHFRCL